MRYLNTALSTLGVFAPAVYATCVEVHGDGHVGLSSQLNLYVSVDGVQACTIINNGGTGSKLCGQGRIDWDWTAIQGPWEVVWHDTPDPLVGYPITISGDNGGTWNCDNEGNICCGGNIPCNCWACSGGAPEFCYTINTGIFLPPQARATPPPKPRHF